MKQSVKKLWVEALRSGKYRQCTESLRSDGFNNDDGGSFFCCLGVLCDIAEHKGVVKRTGKSYGESMDLGFLPQEVRKWADLSEKDPKIASESDSIGTLTDANDGGLSFREIADLIEEQL